MYYLYEGPLGLSLFRKGGDKLELVSHHAYKTIEEAFDQQRAIPGGDVTKVTQEFLESNFPANLRSEKLGVIDPRLAQTLKSQMSLLAVCNDEVSRIHREVLGQLGRLLPQVNVDKRRQYEAALAHDASRLQIRFNVEAVDTLIVQAVKLHDEADKEANVYAMRLAEWAVWSFPEAQRIVPDTGRFCRLMAIIGADRASLLSPDTRNQTIQALKDFLSDEIVDALIAAAQVSVGVSIAIEDREKVQKLANLVLSLQKQKDELQEYIDARMNRVAPNFTAIVGAAVGARLLARAGSLMKLAKAPASTIQILGAEATLFKALKAGSKTPKYGFLYGCQLVQQANQSLKGKVARKVAQAAALCVRYDTLHEHDNSSNQPEEPSTQLAQRLMSRCDVTAKQVQKTDKVAKLQQYRLRTDALTESEAAKETYTHRTEYKQAEKPTETAQNQESKHKKHRSRSNNGGETGENPANTKEADEVQETGEIGESGRRHRHKHKHRKVDH